MSRETSAGLEFSEPSLKESKLRCSGSLGMSAV